MRLRRAVTGLLVAAVVAVGAAAAVDGIRGNGEADAEPVPSVETGPVVIDAEDGDEPAELSVETSVSVERPAGVAVADGSVWVASRDTLARIDPARGAIRQRIELGGPPEGVVGTSGALYVLDELTSDAFRIDPTTAAIVGRLDADIPVLDVALADGDAWIPDPAGSAILRVDPFTGIVLNRIAVAAPTAVVAGSGDVWALSPQAAVVTHIDTASNLVTAIRLDDPPGQIAAVDGAVWVSHPGARVLSRIDPARDEVVARVELESEPLLMAGGAGALWVLGVERLALVDTATGRVTATATLELARPPGPQPAILGGLAAGHGAVWIADTYGDAVLRVVSPAS
jgi:streptogramin lyase